MAPRNHRRRCACGAVCITSAHIERPVCWMCRRERLGLDPVQPRGVGRAVGYWRADWRARKRSVLAQEVAA